MIKRPDYHHWLEKPWWRLDDAVLVVLGIDPESQSRPRKRPKEGGLRMKVSTPPNVFWDFLDTSMKSEGRDLDVIEYSSEGALGSTCAKVEPLVFVKWAQKLGYLIPPELLKFIKKYESKITTQEIESVSELRQGKRERQLEVIEKAISKLRFDSMNIPFGGKQEIRKECEKEDSLFTGHNSFNNAWKEARNRDMVRMKKHESYAK